MTRRTIALIFIGYIVLCTLFPPFQVVISRSGATMGLWYGFLFAPPQPADFTQPLSVHVALLIGEYVGGALIAYAAYLGFSEKR
jgi:hypothetical protein